MEIKSESELNLWGQTAQRAQPARFEKGNYPSLFTKVLKFHKTHGVCNEKSFW